MRTNDELKSISTILRMKENDVFENYIEYITFPFYKNLERGTTIHFDFPMTVLVGKNGSGKSSTLHALFGSPNGYNLGDFWFSTEVDPIKESGEANRFFYGYRESKGKEIKEVMMTRSKRGKTKTKKEDPDYWETRRPSKRDGMKKTDRYAPVNKSVIYIDFRAEISAFDKILHFSKFDLKSRKEILRKRSKYVNRLFEGEKMRFPGSSDEKKGTREILPENTVKIISEILGKKYKEIRIAKHNVYNNPGVSALIQTETQGRYSEANAGSGEFVVIQLVRQIEAAPDFSLILLDEPEVSIHPGAQKRLKEYLLETIIKKKVQVVISTHSPVIIENIPNEAIKLYKTTLESKFRVYEDITYQEAFFDIEDRPEDKKIIYCEDYAAREILRKVLSYMGNENLFEIIYLPGGADTLIGKYMPPFALNDSLNNKIYFFLDGDKKNNYRFKGRERLTAQESKDVEFLKKQVKCAYGMEIETFSDGGNGGRRDDQKCEIYLKYLQFYESNLFYLSEGGIPEEILLSSEFVKKEHKSIIMKYDVINYKNAKNIISEISKNDFGDNEHIKDTITSLAYKWSLEKSEVRESIQNDLITILNRN